VPELFDTLYRDFTARHFHEKLITAARAAATGCG